MKSATEFVRPVSRTFPRKSWDRILREAKPFTEIGHYRYPDDADGNHSKGFFAIEPVSRSPEFIDAIAADIERWAKAQSIAADVIFAPAQAGVRPLADAVAARLGLPVARWEYLPSGRFGDRLVEGSVPRGSRAIALNGVSLSGRCVGLRLPRFVEALGGTVVAAAVFAKGTADFVRRTEERLGDRFYSTVQADVPLYPATECPLCASGEGAPRSWREFAEAAR
jgi:orotate phosphoribosyltransferase